LKMTHLSVATLVGAHKMATMIATLAHKIECHLNSTAAAAVQTRESVAVMVLQ